MEQAKDAHPDPWRDGGEGLELTEERVEAFLDSRREKGCKTATLGKYRYDLAQLMRFLPEDRRIRRDTLPEWHRRMGEEGLNLRTLNSRVSVANSFLDFMGRRDLQMSGLPRTEEETPPELSRGEYLRLLQAARSAGDEWGYLLAKVFARLGLSVSELPDLTVEAVGAGRLELNREGEARSVRVPGSLREELLRYVRRQGRASGPVFLTQSGRTPARSRVSDTLRALCRLAQVPEEKGNPRCLRRFYHSTMAEVEERVRRLAEQTYDWMLETEQAALGWETPAGE